MGLLGWIGGGLAIGAGIGAGIGAVVGATIATGGAATPAALAIALKIGTVSAGAVVGSGAAAGVGAGAVAGAVAGAAVAIKKTRSRMGDNRRHEEEEEEEKAWRRQEEEEKVSRQSFVFFCVLRCSNGEEATSSPPGQNNEKTQGTGTQTHHGSTSKQDKAQAARGGAPGGGDPPGGGGGRRDQDGDSDQEKSDSEKESDSEEDSQQTGEPKRKKSDQKKKKGKKVTVLTANLRSLFKKELKVLILVQENQVDVACLTETFLDKKIARLSLRKASGQNFSYQYRNRQVPAGQRRSGGVAMMFSIDLLGERRYFGSRTTFEYDGREVQHVDWIRPIMFICMYRPPGTKSKLEIGQFLQELEELLDQTRLVSQSIIVTGDFNIWVDQNRLSSRMFQDFLNRNHLQQHVNQPTCTRGNPQHTLDLVLTRNVQISDVSVGQEPISDHYPVFFKARPDQSSEEEEEEEEDL